MRQVLVNLALIGFLCRALVPVGFMPAPFADGGPIRICHGGTSGALLTALLELRSVSEEHAHGDLAGQRLADDHERNANHDGWERCPVGAVFAFAVLVSDFALPLLPLDHVLARGDSNFTVLPAPLGHYQARAPPHV